ncbi:NUDIX hydrolase [Microbacterium lacticum]|uniref:NUDIX hydrolase n=1 Tax=Microbacterium lacticum TaxID=33885 RepID=UPI0018B05A0A|nr:NUDIX hydrolase [Microbacterium lacticum]MBF9335015.1 NUDIX hydrolase [Microbacterium lacticum]
MDLRVAAYAVVFDEERGILLAHWHEGRRAAWTLPGGGLEDGEDPADAVRREVCEETGFRVEIDELLGIHSRVIPVRQRITPDADAPLHTLRIVYRAHVTGGRLRNEVGGSTDEADWFALGELPAVQHVQLVDIGIEMAGL